MEQRPILVVDDDEVVRSSVELALADEGFPVVAASDGAAAVAIISHQPLLLVLLDMKMPCIDGLAFAQAYRQQPRPHAPIIVMTTAADPAQCAAEVGAEAFLGKPYELRELLNLVGRILLGA
jgi:CheY-like chemotaxis protein